MSGSEDVVRLGREIFKRMVAVQNNTGIYPPNHPAVIEPAEEMCELLKQLFAEDCPRVSFSIVNAEIYVERLLLREESIRCADFIGLLMGKGVNNLLFDPTVTPESISTFFSFLGPKNGRGEGPGVLKELVKGAGVKGIGFEELVAIDLTEDVYEMKGSLQNPTKAANDSYDGALQYMETLSQDILSNGIIDSGSMNMVISALIGDFLTDKDAIVGLMSIKNYSEHLFHHSVNVALTCLVIATRLNLLEEMMTTVGVSGLLHDIGKLRTPRDILDKPGKLTDEEWEIMKLHPTEGAQMLMRYESLGELPVIAAMQHHAGADLSGYPSMKGKKPPHMIARIVSIADVYEAMTAERSYRRPCSVNDAMGVLMAGAGKQFDPQLLKMLVDAVGVFPPGSRVRLKTGQIAVVVEPNDGDPFHPKVRPIGSDFGEEDLIDTSEDPVNYAVVAIADSPES